MTLESPLDWLMLLVVSIGAGLVGAAIGSLIIEFFGWNR